LVEHFAGSIRQDCNRSEQQPKPVGLGNEEKISKEPQEAG
jgi:hypothetical protein